MKKEHLSTRILIYYEKMTDKNNFNMKKKFIKTKY